jgi:hypothetical protein
MAIAASIKPGQWNERFDEGEFKYCDFDGVTTSSV